MQQLVAQYPEIITDGDGDLLLIAREPAIGDGETKGRWALDHLFVTREGVPVLVELKRASDTRIRREVVGQLIDYAANASAHWESGTIAAAFARTAGEEHADAVLADFIDARDPSEFWEQVESNLSSGRIKLVFVADVVPRELATVVEFLNEQMRADVRAVELRWFSSSDGKSTTLSPRVIGETARASISKDARRRGRMSVDEWLSNRLMIDDDEVLEGIAIGLRCVDALGGRTFVPLSGGSIVGAWPTADGKTTYPFGVYPKGLIVLRLGNLKHRPSFRDDPCRKGLYDTLTEIVGPLHTNSIAGEPGFDARLLKDPTVLERYRSFLSDVVVRARKA
ncbi:hypothetical protein AAG594_04235 [Citromicrobium bathyomarinum]